MPFPGVTIFTEFITTENEKVLEEEIEARPWAKSQSGRLKQVRSRFFLAKPQLLKGPDTWQN